jgi:WD40 repeat protein
VESIEPAVPSELAAIVSKAMARNPEDRYPTAKELVEDLRRFHTGQLVSAHPYSRRELLWRWLRRHKVVVSAATTALIAVGLIGMLSLTRVIRERERARELQALAESARRDSDDRANALVLLQARGHLGRDPASTVAWLKQYPTSAEGWNEARDLLLDARSRGVARHVLGPGSAAVHTAIFSADGALAATGGDDRSVKVWDVRTGKLLRQQATGQPVLLLAESPDGRYLAAGGAGAVEVFDWNLKTVGTMSVPGAGVFDISFAPDAATLAAAGGGSGAVHVLDLKTGRSNMELRDTGFVRAAMHVDATSLISAGSSGRLLRWYLPSGANDLVVDGLGEVTDIEVSVDARAVIAGDKEGHVVVVDLRTRRAVHKKDHVGRVEGVTFAPDGGLFASSGEDGTVRLYKRDGSSLRTFRHDGEVYCLWFSPDGRELLSAGLDQTVRVWDVDSPTSWTLRGHESAVNTMAPSSDGRWIISGSHDTTARIWPMPHQRGSVVNLHKDDVYQIALSQDGRYVATASRDRTVGFADIKSKQDGRLEGHRDLVFSVDFFPEGHLLASASFDGTVRIWDVDERRQVRELSVGDARLWSVDVSMHGKLVAAGDANGVVHVWDTATWSHRSLHSGGGDAWIVQFSPDGRRIAAGTNSGRIYLWDSTEWKETLLSGHTGYVAALRFIDENHIVSGSLDGTVRRWDLRRNSSEVLSRQSGAVTDVATARGGAIVASASEDRSVALWRGGRATLLGGHSAKVRAVAFSSDALLLASAAEDGSIRLWRPSDGRLLDVLTEHSSFVMDVAFLPDRGGLASASIDRSVRLWLPDATTSPGVSPAALRRTMAELTSFDIPGSESRVAP